LTKEHDTEEMMLKVSLYNKMISVYTKHRDSKIMDFNNHATKHNKANYDLQIS